MNKLLAIAGVAAAVLLAAPAVSMAQSHHGGGSHGGGGSSSSSSGGGGFRGQGSAVRESGGGFRSGAARGGGFRGGYRGGYGRGYGYGPYRGYGFYPIFGFGFEAAFFDPWYGGYPFYYGAPWYYDYVDGGPYPPPGVRDDPYGVPESWVRDRYPDRPSSAWDRDYGSSYDRDGDDRAPPSARGASNAPCGQWVWNEGAQKYDWQAGVCAPSAAAAARAGVDAPPLRVPPAG